MFGLSLSTHDGEYVGLVFATDIEITPDGRWHCSVRGFAPYAAIIHGSKLVIEGRRF